MRKELNELLHSKCDKDNFTRITTLEHDIEKMVVQNELHWKQRARLNWLAHGDGNTKIFHSFASDRKRSNHIKGIFANNGVWHSKERKVVNVFVNYFQELFSSTNLMYKKSMWFFLI